MTNIYSYPSVFAIGHKMIADIFNGNVTIEEKIDGSQFSFGIINETLVCRSKGKELILDNPEKMFQKAVNTARKLEPHLQPEWIYRAEYLEKPKHNTLVYDRVPNDNLIIFDICTGLETYLTYQEKKMEADRLGLECVPIFYAGTVENFEQFNSFLENTSILGGAKIEGVVVKNYNFFTPEKKISIGKYVSESFKEVHGGEWRKNNPTSTDIITQLINQYRTPARWQKAINHLKDNGELDNSPKDIGKLIKEVGEDVKKECIEEIKDALFTYAWSKIKRGITAGLPEWYKETLAKSVFEENVDENYS